MSDSKKPVQGRPKIQLEDYQCDGWKLLDSLIIWSAHEAYLASELNMSVDTLTKRIRERFDCTFTEYRERIKEKTIRKNIKAKQFEVAMEGNTPMLIWLGKNECGQSDKQDIQTTGNVTINIDNEDAEL